MRKNPFALSVLFALFCGCGSYTPRPSLPAAVDAWHGPVRRVGACLALDRAAPPSPAIVRDALADISRAAERHAGVAFDVVAEISFDGDLLAHPLVQARSMRRRCPGEAELLMIFSDRRVRRGDTHSALRDTDPDAQLAGQSQSRLGLLIMYRVDERAKAEDAAGNSAFVTAFTHEIGHLFGLTHTPNRASFMFAPSELSRGEWHPGTVEAFRRNRERCWSVPVEPVSARVDEYQPHFCFTAWSAEP